MRIGYTGYIHPADSASINQHVFHRPPQPRPCNSCRRGGAEFVSILHSISFLQFRSWPEPNDCIDSTTEHLDIAPAGLFACIGRDFINEAPPSLIPEELKAQAPDVVTHWVTEHGSIPDDSTPGQLTGNLKFVPTVWNTPEQYLPRARQASLINGPGFRTHLPTVHPWTSWSWVPPNQATLPARQKKPFSASATKIARPCSASARGSYLFSRQDF